MMNENTLLANLCYYDPKNPEGVHRYDPETDRKPRAENCCCDNCFYGRDKLAMEILEMRS